MVLKPNTQPTVSTSRRTVIIFSIFGIFGLMLASFFIFDLSELSTIRKSGPLLLKNPSFEKWRSKTPVGWENTGATLTIQDTHPIDGNLSVEIYNKSNEKKGLLQKVKLNPTEIYNIRYSLKSNNADINSVGLEIKFEGEDVRTTTDVTPGVHYHANGKKWTQYFGRVTGARSASLFFFAKNNAIATVDAVGIGVNVMPANMTQGNLSTLGK